jgi:glucose/mannose-6-phosphate isomerase
MSGPFDESVLDDQAALARRDPGGMLRALATSGAQVRQAALRFAETDLQALRADGRPRAVVVCGMGGSGVAGDLLVALAGPTSPVPVLAHRGAWLPGWVGPMDLVVAVSCSGVTPETLAVAEEARRRGARLVTVGRAGSPLAARPAGPAAVHLAVDGGDRMPRANLWALSVPVLMVAAALGLVDVAPASLEGVADRLDRLSAACGPAAALHENPAKQLALELADALPQVWGAGDLAAAAAYRFSCQVAENAKLPCLYGGLPEVGHNQVVALAGRYGAGADAGPDDLFRDRVADGPGWPRLRLVLLSDPAEVEPVRRRAAAARALAERYGVGVSEVRAEGEHPVARLASLLLPLDFASVYLALLHDVDPSPIHPITELKESLAG